MPGVNFTAVPLLRQSDFLPAETLALFHTAETAIFTAIITAFNSGFCKIRHNSLILRYLMPSCRSGKKPLLFNITANITAAGMKAGALSTLFLFKPLTKKTYPPVFFA